MSRIITYNNKRYEVLDDSPDIGSLVIGESRVPYIIETLTQLIAALYYNENTVQEIPISTENTLSYTEILDH